jgi:hypothetical protein
VALLLYPIVLLITACRPADPVESSLNTIFQSYYEAISTSVGEPHRVEALMNLGRDLEPRLDEEIRKLVLLHKGVAELNADYDTSRHDMDAHLAVIQHRRQSIRVLLMAARADIVHLTTPEEWEQLQRRSNTLVDWLNSDAEGF